jgi:hypothetical protein
MTGFSLCLVEHHRQMIGIDGLTITPADIHGMAYAYVIDAPTVIMRQYLVTQDVTSQLKGFRNI